MTFAFYAIPMATQIGYQFTFLFFAIMGSVLAFIPILGLMWKGHQIRRRLGTPKNINALDEAEETLATDTIKGAMDGTDSQIDEEKAVH